MELDIKLSDQYAVNGQIRDVLREAGIDYTGDRMSPSGEVEADSPAEAAERLAAVGAIGNVGLARLREIGLEV